ncbi:MAG: amidohydrolase family protein [Kiritimatiellae bacterium]|jgi:predicted TIM-barrel fold metal-dependent hydrolase|nr:amidohydrolase family protein [Kiritimatiellia bacterium]
MVFNDIHIHSHAKKDGQISTADLLKRMDKAGLEHIAVLSWYGRDLREQRDNIIQTGKLIAKAPDRIYGLAWIEPRHKMPLGLLDWAVEKYRYRGFKMIPNNWYPYEEPILKYCAKMAVLKAPCLFHSGILYFETFSSRFCRPAYYEALLQIPRFRFALAHISWPWTDECLALFGHARSARNAGYSTAEMFIDITPGTPPNYREDALRRLIAFGAEDFMIYGTDSSLSNVGTRSMKGMKRELAVYKRAGISFKTAEKICRSNFELFFSDTACQRTV